MLSDRTLARRIALHYYGKEPRIESIASHNNAVFRLHFPDSCKVLKLAADSGATLLRKEETILKSLAQHGIPVPPVEYADDGNRFGRPFMLTLSAGMQTVIDWVGCREELSGPLFTEMGVVLARIHALPFPQADLGCRDFQHEVADVYRRAGELAEQGFLGRDEVAQLPSLDVPPLRGTALCHGDFHCVQCVVHGGRITAVVDWESAWAGNAVVDLAITHAYLDYYCPIQLIRSFFAGYTSICPLPAGYERKYLPVRMAQALGLLCFFQQRSQPSNVQRAVELYRAYYRLLE
jgi:Ser/Thr protein kinase RdoA (MazF antagonist)